jgi:selenocysteine lyase/cysteine desulfurase
MPLSRRDFVSLVSATAAAGVAKGSVAQPMTTLSHDDPLGIRDDFPVTHNHLYFNSPYIAASPTVVVDAAIRFTRTKAEDPLTLGPMLAETRAVREKFARLVNADLGEIGLLATTSEAENIVTAALDLRPGENVVIDDLHFDTTVVLYNHLREKYGIDVRVVRNTDGAIAPDAFAAVVDDRTRLLSVSWVSHQNGFRHDLKALANLAHAHSAYLFVDAIQGLGTLEFDAKDCGVDFFAAGTYKWLLGGFGVAPFFVKKALLELIEPDRRGWRQIKGEPIDHEFEFYDDARKYGYGTPAFAAVYQLSAALNYLEEIGIGAIESHTVMLAQRIHQGLTEQGFNVLTPMNNRSSIVAFEHGTDHERAQEQLDNENVRLSFREDNTQIRVGAALFNNVSDVDRLLEITGTWNN